MKKILFILMLIALGLLIIAGLLRDKEYDCPMGCTRWFAEDGLIYRK